MLVVLLLVNSTLFRLFFGIDTDNSQLLSCIAAMSNLCRDESCMVLEDKIESVFGSCFSTHGLGGVLTCGVIGIKAGLSHSPVQGVSNKLVTPRVQSFPINSFHIMLLPS